MLTLLTFLRKRILYVILAIVLIGISVVVLQNRNNMPTWVTDTVSVGEVRDIISVSGAIDAVGSAELAFPVGGTLESLTVVEGATVTPDQILATLTHNDLKADYADAEASVKIAEADRDELVNGQSSEEREVSKTTVDIAREELSRITREQDERVANARRTLLSSALEARPTNKNNADTPPTITGSYTCDEGTYSFDIFQSSSPSGYSYRLQGLQSGVYTAFTESSAPLGDCGLRIQFADTERYSNASWTIEIPNTASSVYTGNMNAYNLALTERANSVRAAEQSLLLAEQNLNLDTAVPRSEALARAEARVLQAKARLNVIAAQIKDHILTAPFNGMITNIEPVPGEAVGTTPIITIVSEDAFALTALISEIDITHVQVGQKASVVFDARQSETLTATVTFISPLAKEVDGVSYFEAKFNLDSPVDWLRSGLNADVDIIVEQRDNVTRIPKRYIYESGAQTFVNVPAGESTKAVPIEVLFTGNDGFIHISGLNEGDVIIAP